jgi:hypothetical protein
MDLDKYFEVIRGLGVLATSDAKGNVDAAIYARPHVIDRETVAFIMGEKTTHRNLQSNPHAAYLFKEAGEGYNGKRLFLTKVREEKNSDLIPRLRRRRYDSGRDSRDADRYLVYFKIDNIVPLVGSGSCPIAS